MVWRRVKQVMGEFFRDEDGQDLVEYALVAVVIALAATAGMSAVARDVNQIFVNIARKMSVRGT